MRVPRRAVEANRFGPERTVSRPYVEPSWTPD